MGIRSTAVSGVLLAAALGALAVPGPAAAEPGSHCWHAVQQTRADLRDAGAPSDATDWEGVRDDARGYLDAHPSGPQSEALRGDVNNLNHHCAA
ncbi:hypothetical protein AB0M43_10385 [Longispora sp. NPDC051575]|uniref:hypothetical protein n=1 Tax=Longispora sp. NPDC051575 TaxID=3154943 RepID=UPI00342D69BC